MSIPPKIGQSLFNIELSVLIVNSTQYLVQEVSCGRNMKGNGHKVLTEY